MVVADRIQGQLPLTIVARLHALLLRTEVVGTVVQRLHTAVARTDAQCRLMEAARLRARCLPMVEEGEVELLHRAVEALVEADRQAAVGAADTPQLQAQAVVAASTEAAGDTNLTLIAGKITPPFRAAFFLRKRGEDAYSKTQGAADSQRALRYGSCLTSDCSPATRHSRQTW
jgi:hypothetical protein